MGFDHDSDVAYGTLKNPSYRPHALDQRIAEGLSIFGAACIQGSKYCGKTWSGRSLSNSEINLMDPTGNFASRATAELVPDLALEGASPRLVDEWQEVPQLWDAMRNTVDASAKQRTFVLTGSASPRNIRPRAIAVLVVSKNCVCAPCLSLRAASQTRGFRCEPYSAASNHVAWHPR